jgi:hypothetical protein
VECIKKCLISLEIQDVALDAKNWLKTKSTETRVLLVYVPVVQN